MKSLKLLFITILLAVIGISATAQDHSKSDAAKTETFKVSGACGMCKARIEKAAKSEGVSMAEWDSKTQTFSLTYDPARVKTDDVLKKIAAVGHDNEKYKAEQSVYDKLPGCCQYR